jgi:hypothetical protein
MAKGSVRCSIEFRHPSTIIDKELLKTLGQSAASAISSRVQQGIGVGSRPMPQLTERYARVTHHGDRTRRLTLTGKMLLSARLGYERSAVTIEWMDPKAAWHQNKVHWIGLSRSNQEAVDWAVRFRWTPPWDKHLRTKKRSR